MTNGATLWFTGGSSGDLERALTSVDDDPPASE